MPAARRLAAAAPHTPGLLCPPGCALPQQALHCIQSSSNNSTGLVTLEQFATKDTKGSACQRTSQQQPNSSLHITDMAYRSCKCDGQVLARRGLLIKSFASEAAGAVLWCCEIEGDDGCWLLLQ